jgi:hypothetical protein
MDFILFSVEVGIFIAKCVLGEEVIHQDLSNFRRISDQFWNALTTLVQLRALYSKLLRKKLVLLLTSKDSESIKSICTSRASKS